MNPIDAFLKAIVAAGMQSPAEIHGDGRIHRFSPTGKRSDDAAWYVLHLDGVPAGAFGNWRDGLVQCWCAKAEREMSAIERKAMDQRIDAMRRQRDAEMRRRHAEAAAAAAVRWASALPAQQHPYLSCKGVRSHGVRVEAGHTLLVPMRDTEGRLHSLQTISPDGDKRFLRGGRVRGCYHAIGRPSGKLVVCEGFATGATIHEDTGSAVAVAFNAGNLQPVAQALRAKYPCLTIIIAADDDWRTDGNPGLTAARQAAAAAGALLAVPNFTGLPRGDKDTDFNDLHRLAGAVEVSV
ncbi:toprim domain-containing protein [Variovorax soli]|uniref:DNA primase/helicase n=1 Tax=Variovorax soli TaxID=376815 RepID=A0ABU1NET3_9BURK|nr:toprim domain-containing protein [Variovorax soli]MDR6536967.1 putative DNA primase/helicase [Variovorax soli]